MPIRIKDIEYLSIDEACEYLGGISRETLRRQANKRKWQKYTQGVRRNVYYRKDDVETLQELRPLNDNDKEG
jgi:predicted DNA-binding protein (UPF0251 family)